MPRGQRGAHASFEGNPRSCGQGSPGRQRTYRHKPEPIYLKIFRRRSRDVIAERRGCFRSLRSPAAGPGRSFESGKGLIVIGDAGEKPITIKEITVDPPLIPDYGTARITIHARSARGWPLEFEVAASEGSVEPTDEPNVFLWHGPKSPRRRRTVLGRRARASTTRQR